MMRSVSTSIYARRLACDWETIPSSGVPVLWRMWCPLQRVCRTVLAHAPFQYVQQAFVAALSTRQAPVQYVQQASAVALPSSHAPVQYA